MAEQVFSNRYEIVRHLARGGMAEVYLARDLLLDRPVALKVLFPQLSADPSFVERFRREAQASANLNHPNIVSVYDWGEEGSTYFIVMEYVEGPTLRDVLRTEHRLHPDRAADIAAEIASALSFAHRNGVVHRDVKPGNVLLVPTGQVKVTDFGIARAARDSAQDNLTQTGTVMGTATYFSPEQAQGLPIDARTDVYALGVVLYELVTGRPPFVGDSPVAIAYQHVQEDPMPPSRANPDVPPALEAVILRALAKSPDGRYASANDMRADLLQFRRGGALADETVLGAAPVVATQVAPPADSTAVAPAVGGTAVTSVAAPPAPPAGPSRRTGAYIALLVVLLAVLGLLLFFLSRELTDGGGAADVAVPSVITRSVEDAERVLREAGLVPVREDVENAQVQAGVVFDQEPKDGATVERGSEVLIRVSSGTPPVVVPEVVGDDVEAARAELAAAGLNAEVTPQPHDQAPAGQVLTQDPAPDAEAPRGSAVKLTVSSGPAQVQVPNVVGEDANDAANILGRAGFETEDVTEPSNTVPAGEVIRTDPPAGTPAAKGSKVRIIASSGRAVVPNVVGLPEDVAVDRLQDGGFTVVTESETRCSADREGQVVDQDPDAQSQVPQGSSVTITVCRPPAVPTTVARTTTTAPDPTTTTSSTP